LDIEASHRNKWFAFLCDSLINTNRKAVVYRNTGGDVVAMSWWRSGEVVEQEGLRREFDEDLVRNGVPLVEESGELVLK